MELVGDEKCDKLVRTSGEACINTKTISKQGIGGGWTWKKAAETGLRRGSTGVNRDLGIRSRAAMMRLHGRALKDDRSRPLYMWKDGKIMEEGGESSAKRFAAKYKGGKRGGELGH